MKKKLILMLVMILAIPVLASCSKGYAEVTLPCDEESEDCFWTYSCDANIEVSQENIMTDEEDESKRTVKESKFTIVPSQPGDSTISFYYTNSSIQNWEAKAEYSITAAKKSIKENSASYVDEEGNELDPIHLKTK